MYLSVETNNEPPPTAPPEMLEPPQTTVPSVVGPTVHALAPLRTNVSVVQMSASIPVPWSTGLFDCYDDIDNCMGMISS
jgi:hypothetical protein